jgi:hypothetical protein
MCTLPDERYRAECPVIQRRVTQEKLEDIVKDKCCEKCDAYEPFCRDGCPVFIDEYENQCRRDEREKLLVELEKRVAAYIYPDYERERVMLIILSIIDEFRSSKQGGKQE